MLVRLPTRAYGAAPDTEQEESSVDPVPAPPVAASLPFLPGVTPKTFMQTVFFSMAISLTAQFILARVRRLFAKRARSR